MHIRPILHLDGIKLTLCQPPKLALDIVLADDCLAEPPRLRQLRRPSVLLLHLCGPATLDALGRLGAPRASAKFVPPRIRKRLVAREKRRQRVLFAFFKAKVVALRQEARGAVPFFVIWHGREWGVEAKDVEACVLANVHSSNDERPKLTTTLTTITPITQQNLVCLVALSAHLAYLALLVYLFERLWRGRRWRERRLAQITLGTVHIVKARYPDARRGRNGHG